MTLKELNKKFGAPLTCPSCGAELVIDGVNLCCKNKKCEDQVVNQLVLFIKNLGVKSASNATLKNFGITSFEDLVKFEPNKKYKSELKLAEELNDKMFSRSKLDLLCNMTCFGGLAETTLRKIIDFYASKGSKLDDFLFSCDSKGYALNTNMKDLWMERYGLPDGVGELTLDKFQDGLEEAYNIVMLVVDNPKYKAQFGTKAKMLGYDEVESCIGHGVGGVCPFAINEGVNVYLDESLKRFDTVFPACGSSNSAIELTLDELEKYARPTQWVDVCKGWQ